MAKSNKGYTYVGLAYCEKCGELIVRSPKSTKKEIRAHWNEFILMAPLQFPRCPKCYPDKKIGEGVDFGYTFKIEKTNDKGEVSIIDPKDIIK